ncbi:MAG: hypothetical protein QW540_10760 [Archaeoglobaceae archaeon]|uniref:Uncharacterized protein n=1 Tax=Archaeoglobus fulgidus TaxID=2234 RepID=A0A7J3M2X2_ARCFL
MKLKGVSEVLGSLLVLLTIVGVAGIIYTMSYSTILSGQENVKMRNAYFDMFELREKIDRVRSGLEFKSVYKIQLYDLSVDFGNEPIVIINNTNYNLASIKLIGRGWTITYENGAIILSQNFKPQMMSSPNVNYVKETRTLYFPAIKLKTNLSTGGIGAITIYFHLNNIKTVTGNGSIVFYSNNADTWKEFFELIGVDFTRSGNNITIHDVNYFVVIYEVEVYG